MQPAHVCALLLYGGPLNEGRLASGGQAPSYCCSKKFLTLISCRIIVVGFDIEKVRCVFMILDKSLVQDRRQADTDSSYAQAVVLFQCHTYAAYSKLSVN